MAKVQVIDKVNAKAKECLKEINLIEEEFIIQENENNEMINE